MDFGLAVGIGSFAVLLSLIVLGVPIFVSMLLVSAIGFWVLGGFDHMLSQFTWGVHAIAENYMFAVLPLFMLMGEIATETGLAEKSFAILNKWVGKIRGGLLMATIGANGLLGAISATPMAGHILSVRVAMPQLEKLKYDKPFCLAAIIAAGTLATLIPPSAPVITFCIITNASVGRSLVAGIIPGILLTLVFCVSIWIYGKISPQKVPATGGIQVSWREKFSSLTALWPILALFLLIIGGIYFGVFPPTVGGAIGAVGTLIYALVVRTDKRKIGRSFQNTVIMNSGIFPMLIAGFMFSRLTALTHIADYLTDFVVGLQVPPLLVMAIVVILYIIISFPMDLLPAMIITLPVFYPLLTNIGFSPYLLVVVCTLLMTLSVFTPPTGTAVYVVASMARVNPWDIWRGVIPWFITIFIFVWVIILIPPIATWLPNLFYD